MSVPIRRSAVYWIPDTAVTLPPTPNSKRNFHPRRPFLVLSNDERNTEAAWPVVMGFPLSTADTFVSEYDVEIPAGKGNLASRCFVQVPLLQPIAKSKLLEWIGQIDAATMEEIVAQHLSYAGAL